MTPDTALAWAQTAAQLVDPPWGPRIIKIAGHIRGALGRIEADLAPIEALLNEVLPIIAKHPEASKALYDLLPIVQAIVKDAQE